MKPLHETQETQDQTAQPLTDDIPLQGEGAQLNINMRLLVADLAIIGQAEMWFRLFFSRDAANPDILSFVLRLAGYDHTQPYRHLCVHFGTLICNVELDESGAAAWSLPASAVLDRKSGRIMRPITLSLPAPETG